MSKIIEFLKSKALIIKWTIGYFFVLWLILKYIFKFDMFSYNYWWKFFHASLHGFYGFVFGILIYSAIPIYIAGAVITQRKQTPIVTIPFADKIFEYVKKLFVKPQAEPEPESEPEEAEEETIEEFPADMPPELRIPFKRAKNNLPLTNTISAYNKTPVIEPQPVPVAVENYQESTFPIPMDFDINDTMNESDMIPQFTDLNFDTPIATEPELKNETTKYFDANNIEYETYRDFVGTEKYVIYEHNDKDFWVMDGDSWFAAGKQKDSPIPELLSLATQNEIQPVLYLATQNIMDLNGTIDKFTKQGIKVISDLSELD